MTKNKSETNPIEQVQKTAKEAERLLNELEDPEQSKESFAQSIAQIDGNKNTNNNTSQYPEGSFIKPIIILTILFGVPILFGVIQSSSDEQKPIAKHDDTPKARQYMNTSEKSFYSKTLEKASNAVLKGEHESAIMGLESLKNGKYREYRDVDQGLVNNKIIQAQKKIAYLDQPGKYKYWETSEYGAQWFDNNPDNQFKVFVAHSRKCNNPSIVFGFLNKQNGPILKRHTVKLKSTMSTILVPMQLDGRQWITLDEFKCN